MFWLRGVSLVVLATVFFGVSAASAMPDNARQSAEGYWVGDVPTAGDIPALFDAGVRLIVSAVRLDDETRAACNRHGIERVNVWFGNNFPDADELLSGTVGYDPSQIYIHCDHGGDRAGAVLAFFLVAREEWRPDHALLAVANPSESDVEGLIAVLQDAGLIITTDERERYAGIYSGASNGGTGGLKIRGPDYRNLVVTTLQALEGLGVTIQETEPPAPSADGVPSPTDAALAVPPQQAVPAP